MDNIENEIKKYKENIEQNPYNQAAVEALCNIYMQYGRKQEAIETIKKILNNNPISEYYYLAGKIYCNIAIQEDENEYENALEAFQNASQLDNTKKEYYLEMGKIYAEVFREEEEAIECYIKALEIEESDEICALIADQYFFLNDYEQQAIYYNKALQINDNNIEANLFKIREMYNIKKDYANCLKYIKKVTSLGEPFKTVELIAGDCLVQLKDYAGAIEVFTNMINNNLNNYLGYSQRAKVFALLGKYEDALQDYSIAIKNNSHMTLLYIERGKIHYKLCHKQEAEMDFNQALKLGYSKDDIDKVKQELEGNY